MSSQILSTLSTSSSKKRKTFKCVDHASNISQKLQTFYEQGELVDIALIAAIDDVKIHAHRVVLSASSDYFQGMFRSTLKEAKADAVQLEAMDGATLKLILGFMYTATIELCTDTVESILRVADFLQMSTLIAACCNFMEEQIDSCNCLGIALFAEQHGYTALYQKTFSFALSHFEKVCAQSEFFQLNQEQVCAFLSNDNLCVSSEEKVFLSLVAWVAHDEVNREESILTLLQLIRFTFLTPKFIIDNSDFVCKSIECNHLIRSWLKWHLSPESRLPLPANNDKPRKALKRLVALTDEFSVQTFNPVLNEWSLENWPLPLKKTRAYGATIINKKLILAGGFFEGCEVNNVQSLDLQTMVWTDLPPMGLARSSPVLCEMSGHLYVIGGYSSFNWTSTVERYNFCTCKWEIVAPLPRSHTDVRAAVLSGLLYVVTFGETRLDCYDPVTNKWKYKCFKLAETIQFDMTVVKGKLYVVGDPYGEPAHAVVECYDPRRDNWTVCSRKECSHTNVKCIALNNRLITCGGGSYENNFFVEEFNPTTKKWKSLVPMLPYRSLHKLMVM